MQMETTNFPEADTFTRKNEIAIDLVYKQHYHKRNRTTGASDALSI